MKNNQVFLGFKLNIVEVAIHGLLFKDTHLVAKDPQKLNNAIKVYLISQNIIHKSYTYPFIFPSIFSDILFRKY